MDFFRSLTDINRNLISVKSSRISGLVESGKFLRHKVDIDKNLRLIYPGGFPKF